jgi:hypothetical protein
LNRFAKLPQLRAIIGIDYQDRFIIELARMMAEGDGPYDAQASTLAVLTRAQKSARFGVRGLARQISVESVRQKYSGANDAKERGDCIQHD